jgi:methylenetetrahydrofolate--tRNA-(uracil-5-)-methyltransferase
MIAALNMIRLAEGQEPLRLPRETMLGALLHYITRPEAINEDFQPINSNWGILPPLTTEPLPNKRDKKERNNRYVRRSMETLQAFMAETGKAGLFSGPAAEAALRTPPAVLS